MAANTARQITMVTTPLRLLNALPADVGAPASSKGECFVMLLTLRMYCVHILAYFDVKFRRLASYGARSLVMLKQDVSALASSTQLPYLWYILQVENGISVNDVINIGHCCY